MEAAEEQVALGSKEQIHIIKGKRTKTVRPQSPVPCTVTEDSSNGEGDAGGHIHSPIDTHKYNDNDDEATINNNTTTCSAELLGSTEEEEDMANCLILLAQGQSWESPKLLAEEDNDKDNDNNNNNLNYSKSSCRKFMEAATMGYECKTCNRTFPSFQALGGHRASHKKPKALASAIMAFDDEEFQLKNKNNHFSLQLNNNNNNGRRNNFCKNKSRVHECSVCGTEFASGQALGGHMRRHRAPVGITTNTTLSLTPLAAIELPDDDQPKRRRKSLSLDLDLNLPAPEDDQREPNPKFPFASKQRQQQQSLVFSATSLVDCRY